MLVSHKYRFIFIKTLKTAGTSVEVDLSQCMADDDIVTPIVPPVEGHVPRNHDGRRFYNHMPAVQVQRRLGRKIFRDYFKFCVEREPVDKCVSFYSMLKNSPEHNKGLQNFTWEDFVAAGRFPLDHRKYTTFFGSCMVDRIVRYENLDEELAEIARALGFPFSGIKTQAKSGFRVKIEPTLHQRTIIYKAFARSNQHTGYTQSMRPIIL